MLYARSQQSDLERVIQALLQSFVIYVIYLGVFGASLPVDWVPTTTGPFQIVIHRSRILTLGLLSLALGFAWGVVKGHDLYMRALRKAGITKRTSRESVWNDVFLNEEGTVQVGLGDGRAAIGRLDRYSDTGEEGSLFLSEAFWVGENDTLVPINGPGLLLTKSSDIKFVMFLNQKRADPQSKESIEQPTTTFTPGEFS